MTNERDQSGQKLVEAVGQFDTDRAQMQSIQRALTAENDEKEAKITELETKSSDLEAQNAAQIEEIANLNAQILVLNRAAGEASSPHSTTGEALAPNAEAPEGPKKGK